MTRKKPKPVTDETIIVNGIEVGKDIRNHPTRQRELTVKIGFDLTSIVVSSLVKAAQIIEAEQKGKKKKKPKALPP